ncbi:prolyl endopeptidase FAP-like [Sinocyclocheilus anshuiensis]|uniref:prolyl endopeptidase FAP-like n=1 Tax=Sinocyclocheilus anshuiensis TaxID=1608454 RepID=UPI0007B809FA|nr:PREDICTED: prolyl endopeptidase FAP-like [Sinocyclocheilus anshuiensis]
MGCNKVCVALVGALVVITLIVIPTAIYVNRDESALKRTYSFNDFYNDTIRYKTYSLHWISDNEYLHKTSEGHIYLHNAETKESSVYLSNSTFAQVDATDYILSADKRFVVFESNYSKLWRHSFTASYHMYNMESREFLSKVQIPPVTQFLVWAPVGNKLAYVWDYNIYLKKNATAEAVQVTHNGKVNKILNGVPDWVYEEEVFASNEAIWWSPQGKYLAYLQINDTGVHNIEYSLYGNDQYPTTVFIPYPKAGCVIPRARLFVIDVENPSRQSEVVVPKSVGIGDHYLRTVTWVTDERLAVQWLPRRQDSVLLQIYDYDGTNWKETSAGCVIPRARLFVIDLENPSRQSEVVVPKSVGIGDHYLRTVTWVTDERLAVQWLPRRQDSVLLQIYDYDGTNWKETSKFQQKSKTGWVGRYFPAAPYFAANNMSFYKVMSNDNGYKHLHYVEAGKATPITSGKWEVIYISKVTKDSIHYVSNEHMGRPGQRNLYNYFSLNASFFRMDCYGPGLPLFTLMDNRGPAKEIQVLEDNKKLEKILTTELLMPTIKRATMKIAGFNLWYQMMFPPNFDSSKKYPLFIQVYGGPASQNTDYVFRLEWATYLCSTDKVIIASFDGRGSGYQGDEIMHAIYGRLGTYEVEDQISAVRKFIEMGFIDKDRIGMWGWSYGGYVTSMVLGSGSGLFKCGIAVAPVAKWDYYDAVYTERYMHRPEENTESYKNSTVTDRAKNFKSVQYMLVHGTADDNVHFQQAAQISKALVENQVDFEAMWYTDKDHGLSGKARYHLYAHLNHFLQNCFAEKK